MTRVLLRVWEHAREYVRQTTGVHMKKLKFREPEPASRPKLDLGPTDTG